MASSIRALFWLLVPAATAQQYVISTFAVYRGLLQQPRSQGVLRRHHDYGRGQRAGGFSDDGGSALDAQIKFPIGVVLDDKGNLFVAQLAGLDLGDGGPAAVAAQ